MKQKKLLLLLLGMAAFLGASAQSQLCNLPNENNEPLPVFPVPTEGQMRWHETEFYAFMHFGINTFTDREWGDGSERESQFAPTAVPDVAQWVKEIKDAGMKGIILTCKHHDGFCLWFTETTGHSVKNASGNGHMDIVKAISDKCREQGLKFGVYISPWDRNNAEYGRDGYLKTYQDQIRELCTNYGELFEMWFDGANGGDGYYGGSWGTRNIDATTYYDWPNTFKIIKDLQPNCVIWGSGGEARWIGNEEGWAGETNWATYDGENAAEYGDENGITWNPGECDAKNAGGWFWHPNNSVKTSQDLFDIYMKSVGRNANLILNIPPNRAGRLDDNDVTQLRGFKTLLDKAFGTDIALHKAAAAESRSGGSYGANNVTDGDKSTYWALDDGVTSGEIEIDLGGAQAVTYVTLQEYIRKGQRVKGFEIYTWNGAAWDRHATGTTIGYKRIMKLPTSVTTQKVKIKITDSKVCPLIHTISVF